MKSRASLQGTHDQGQCILGSTLSFRYLLPAAAGTHSCQLGLKPYLFLWL